MHNIIKAQLPDLSKVYTLFNSYRMFYKRPSDPSAAEKFIKDRLTKKDSVIFLAVDKTKKGLPGIGFAQLYPTLASLGMHKMLVLNDLYVDPNYRNQGVGRALMRQCKQYAIESGVPRLTLSTANTNLVGQKLYESEGYIKETDFMHYSLSLPTPTEALKLNKQAKTKP